MRITSKPANGTDSGQAHLYPTRRHIQGQLFFVRSTTNYPGLGGSDRHRCLRKQRTFLTCSHNPYKEVFNEPLPYPPASLAKTTPRRFSVFFLNSSLHGGVPESEMDVSPPSTRKPASVATRACD